MATNEEHNELTKESNIALGKKLKIDPIDGKTLGGIIAGIGKEKRKPGGGLTGGVKGSSKKPGPVFEFCGLPEEEREILGDQLDKQLKENVLPNSVVSVGEKAFVTDRLTGVPCPYYWVTIPSAQTLSDIGSAINRGAKGKQQRLHAISGKVDSFHGAFATLENLFAFVHCVLAVSVNSPIFRDLMKLYHVEEQEKSFNSSRLHKVYASVQHSKVFGGNTHLIVPAQPSRQGKFLKSPGCFFYGSDNESPYGFVTVKHTILCKRYNLPSNISFPSFSDWENAVRETKNSRTRTIENNQKWKEFAETYGEEATRNLFSKLQERRKKEKEQKRKRGEEDDMVDLDSSDGIVAYGEGFNFTCSTKKPKLVHDVTTESDDDEICGTGIEIEESVSNTPTPTTNTLESVEEDMLIHEFLESMNVELNNENLRRTKYSEWGDDGKYMDIENEIGWVGVDVVDDSSRHYKRTVRKIHSLLKK